MSVSHHQATALQFITLDTGCFVPVSHKLNKDGYFRKTWAVDGAKETEMFHRFIYRAHHNLEEIPNGYEVDHMCGVRCCANIEHLRLIERSHHKSVTNTERYRERHNLAWLHWLHSRCSGTELAQMFEVEPSSGCRWIRGWKRRESVRLAA